MLLKELAEGKEPALHLMPTAGIKVQKFDGKKHDFAAAVTAQYGRPIIKKKGDKTYYLKQGRVVAKYDNTLDKGIVYTSSKVTESANQFYASDVSHEEGFVMVLVRNADEESEDYHGVNVLVYPDGEVDNSTADSMAEKEWKEHKAEIIKIAKAAVGVNEGFADTVGIMIDQTVEFFGKIGNYITGADAKRLKKFIDSDVPKIEDMLKQARKMAPYFKAAERSKILNQISFLQLALAKDNMTTAQMDKIINGCEVLGAQLARYMNPKSNARLKNPKVA